MTGLTIARGTMKQYLITGIVREYSVTGTIIDRQMLIKPSSYGFDEGDEYGFEENMNYGFWDEEYRI